MRALLLAALLLLAPSALAAHTVSTSYVGPSGFIDSAGAYHDVDACAAWPAPVGICWQSLAGETRVRVAVMDDAGARMMGRIFVDGVPVSELFCGAGTATFTPSVHLIGVTLVDSTRRCGSVVSAPTTGRATGVFT